MSKTRAKSGGSASVRGKWDKASRLKNKPPANIAARELSELRKVVGAVTAETLLEHAEDPSSCFHQMYEWDDAKAARKHRLEQSRLILQGLRIVTPDGEEHRMFVAVSVSTEGREKQYVPAVEAIKVPEWREEVKRQALSELRAFKAKYGRFQELEALVASVGRVYVRFSKK